METPRPPSPAYDRRDWLAWSQSPGEGNLPEKGQETASMSIRQPDLFGFTTQEFILQPTSFCNINCDYCYLPHRQSQRRMSSTTLSLVFQAIFSSSLLADRVRIVWHAGEPMTLPIRFYEEAFQLIEQYNSRNLPVTFVFQTNGTHMYTMLV